MAVTPRRLLVLDASYSLAAIRANKLEASVTSRDLGGYFARVWTVHPFATLVTPAEWSARNGRPEASSLDARHVFVEGKVGRFDSLAFLPAVNFVLAQLGMLRYVIRLVRRHGISAVR